MSAEYLTDEDREALRFALAHYSREYDEGSRAYEVVEAIAARHVAAERERIAQAIETLEAPYQIAPMAIGIWSRACGEAARIARGGAR